MCTVYQQNRPIKSWLGYTYGFPSSFRRFFEKNLLKHWHNASLHNLKHTVEAKKAKRKANLPT